LDLDRICSGDSALWELGRLCAWGHRSDIRFGPGAAGRQLMLKQNVRMIRNMQRQIWVMFKAVCQSSVFQKSNQQCWIRFFLCK
jgi:hypothetical protein